LWREGAIIKQLRNLRRHFKMKTLRQLCTATLLSLTLAASVIAGHIETPAAPAPTTSSTTTTGTATFIVLTILNLIRR
jgi:hypothetical protein